MKIAFVRKKYTYHGGAETHLQKLTEALTEKGHEVHIFAAKWDTSIKGRRIFIHKVPAVSFNSIVRDLTFAVCAYFILKKQRPHFDLIQSHDKTLYQDIYFAGDGCHIEWLKKRCAHLGFFSRLSISLNPYHRLILALDREIFKGHRFKKIVAISEMVKKEIIDNYGVDSKEIEIVYHGIDMQKFQSKDRESFRAEIRGKYSIAEDAVTVLFVGSGFERKGLAFLLQAVESCPVPLTVLIVGKGPFNRYKHLIKRKNVIYCGPQAEVHKFYAASDLCVFPSIYEPFGLVHLEALASGLPVITTRRSGGSELIRDTVNGFVVETPEDIRTIAERIMDVLAGNKYSAMSEAARTSVESFTFERHVEQLIEVFKSVR